MRFCIYIMLPESRPETTHDPEIPRPSLYFLRQVSAKEIYRPLEAIFLSGSGSQLITAVRVTYLCNLPHTKISSTGKKKKIPTINTVYINI